MNLRLGHSLRTLRPSLHNGPGWRVSLWVQGCRHRCTDRCLNPHLLDSTGGTEFPVAAVAAAVRAAAGVSREPARGITVLGGEPFEQAAALVELLAPLRQDGWSAMIYSGHTHEGLLRSPDPEVAALLGQTDILVDGPFLPDLYNETIPWRGSTNQRLLCLTDRHNPDELDEAFARQRHGYSIWIGPDRVSVSGLQTPEAAREVARVFGMSIVAAEFGPADVGDAPGEVR